MIPFQLQVIAGIGITVFVLSLCTAVKALAQGIVGKQTRKRRRS